MNNVLYTVRLVCLHYAIKLNDPWFADMFLFMFWCYKAVVLTIIIQLKLWKEICFLLHHFRFECICLMSNGNSKETDWQSLLRWFCCKTKHASDYTMTESNVPPKMIRWLEIGLAILSFNFKHANRTPPSE